MDMESCCWINQANDTCFDFLEHSKSKYNKLLVDRLAQTVAGWQAACEDRQNF